MTQDQKMAIVVASMAITYAVLLIASKKYRDDTAKMFRLEKSSLGVAIENPLATLVFVLSFVIPACLVE